jgi:hypothetical protein
VHSDLAYIGPSWHGWITADTALVRPKIVRTALLWHQIEPTQGQRNWSQMDSAVNHYVAQGWEITVDILGSPSWINGGQAMAEKGPYFADPAQYTAWANAVAAFARDAVLRYKDRIHRWEIWNEQDNEGFWTPVPPSGKVSVDDYVELYEAVYAAIKAADPTAKVAMGGLSTGCCTGPRGYGGFTYLQMMYDRGVFPDVVNIHPYNLWYTSNVTNCDPARTESFTSNFTDIATFRQIMVANGQGNKEIWATEWGGWGTEKFTREAQAACVSKALGMFRDLYPYVTVTNYYQTLDWSGVSWKAGLVDENHVIKPAGVVFRDFVNGGQ